MAMQGKLVEQRPEEGTGEELYQQIQKEKQKLIKEGKIKRQKPLPEITEDEVPFEIPESWKWVRLGALMFDISDGTHQRPNYMSQGTPFISVKDVSSGKLEFDNCKYISKKDSDKLNARCNPEYGNILLTKVGTTGVPAIVDTKAQFSLFVSVALLKFDNDHIDCHYLKFLIESPLVQLQAKENTKGVGNKNWVLRDICNTTVAIPPLAEQKRIVEKIEEIMPFIDRYASAYDNLQSYNTRFPDDLKKSILQMAIQGKLVPQDPNDEPASVLLEKIAKEKQKLVKEGKIKKQKPLPPIKDEEIPFDIPESWEWVRLDDIVIFENGDRGKNYPNKSEYVKSGVAWINTGHIEPNGYLSTVRMNYISQEKFDSLRSGKIAQNDLVFCLRGATFGKVCRVKPYTKGAIASSLMIIRSIIGDLEEYLFIYLKSPLAANELQKYANGSAQPNLGAKDVRKYLIPLPPLAEQKRIVTKLDELLPQIDGLK
jgi:type I restriction enzyme S subunit